MEKIEERLIQEFGSLAYMFMSQTIRGIDMTMPDTEIRKKVALLLQDIKLEINNAKSAEIQRADNKLKENYGEDWLQYLSDRLQELKYERDYIRSTIPGSGRKPMDGETRSKGAVEPVS